MSPEESYQSESRRVYFRCDSYGYNDKEKFDLLYRSELCCEREEKNSLQSKVAELQTMRESERDETREALRDCVFWAESVSRRVTEGRHTINWTGLQKAREALQQLTDHKLVED